MPPTTISIRLPTELLEKLRAAAAARGTTVTELLLGPWRSDGPGAPPNQGSGGRKEPVRHEVTVEKPKPFKSRLKGEWKAP